MFRILVVRLGSMGDVIHALPAVASLKHSFPHSRLSWVIKPRWAPLLEGNPFVDEIIPFTRTAREILATRRLLRRERFELAVDLQGLIQSALVAASAKADKIVGLARTQARESFAAMFYSSAVRTTRRASRRPVPGAGGRRGRVQPVADVSAASGEAGRHAARGTVRAGLSPGGLGLEAVASGPLHGARAKRLNLPLVVNGPPDALDVLRQIEGAQVHLSGLEGLIDATRRAQAIVGVDSGPVHLAAALGKPGVAIYGPTDPASHGPYGGTLHVLRSSTAITSYKRRAADLGSMRAVSPAEVLEALEMCPA